MRTATKTPAEREDEESERLVRKSPKQKPPRHDRRREDMRVDQDPDLKMPKLSGEDRIPAKNRETGEVVPISPETLKAEPGKYEAVKPEEVSKSKPDKPSEEAPETKGEAPKEETPKGEGSGATPPPEGAPPKQKPEEGAKPKGDTKGKEEGKKKPSKGKKPEDEKPPSEADKLGIKPPARKAATPEQKEQAMALVVDSFPPEMAAQVLAQDLHPADVKALVANYDAAKTRPIGNVSEFATKVSKVYQPSPAKVKPPKTWRNENGKRVAFEELSPEEQSEAYSQHQMQVVAMSLAAREGMVEKLSFKSAKGNPAIPGDVAGLLADTLLSKKARSVESDDPKIAELGQQVFAKTIETRGHRRISDGQAKSILKALNKSPAAQKLAQSFLQANDYKEAKELYLKSGKMSEEDSPEKIAKGLKESADYFKARNEIYGATDNRSSEFFRFRVLGKLKELDESKHQAVQAKLDSTDAVDFKKAKKAYDKQKRTYDADLESWKDRQDHAKRFNRPFDEPPPTAPTAPVEPIRISKAREKTQLQAEGKQLWDDLFSNTGQSKTARVASKYLISSYLRRIAMTQHSEPGSKVGLYHGVDPLEHYPTEPYAGWQQAHQRDLGESDFEIILASAKDWLDSAMLSVGTEGMVEDQRYRHALDLAIQSSPYNRALAVPYYNMILARLMGVPEPGLGVAGLATKYANLKKQAGEDRSKLERAIYRKAPKDNKAKLGGKLVVMLTGDAAKALGKSNFSKAVLSELSDGDLKKLAEATRVKTAAEATETAQFVVCGKGQISELTKDLQKTSVFYRDDEGTTHEDGYVLVQDVTAGPELTADQEDLGVVSESVLTVVFPKGSLEETFKAIQDQGRKNDFKIEKASPGYKPGVQKLATEASLGGTDTTGVTNMTLKLAQEDVPKANEILARVDHIGQAIQDNYASWGMNLKAAKEMVNQLDKVADMTETMFFGEASLLRRQANILASEDEEIEVQAKKAKVLQRESDEPYMDTFQNPMSPVQTEGDEPYMAAYGDDQSSSVDTGKDKDGRPLSP